MKNESITYLIRPVVILMILKRLPITPHVQTFSRMGKQEV